MRAEGGQVASDCAGNVLAAAVRSPVWDDVVAFGVEGASALCIKLPPACTSCSAVGVGAAF